MLHLNYKKNYSKYVTIIPARGGSKRFPRKNIYPLNKKPLINYSIEYALNNPVSSIVYVSTDDPEIAKVAEVAGSKIIWRPENLSGDFISTAATLQHAGKELQNSGVEFDYIILLQATNPLRTTNMLTNAIEIIETSNCDSLMTVSPSHAKLGKIINNHYVPWNYKFGQRSQDMESLYYENGLLYITQKEFILNGLISSEQTYPLIIEHIFASVDIDTFEDLIYAEFVMQHKRYE
jgi:N-acylneuraminate cytidylyltransferase